MSYQLKPSSEITKYGILNNHTEIAKAIEFLFNYPSGMVYLKRGFIPIPMNKITENVFIYQWGKVLAERSEILDIYRSSSVKLNFNQLNFDTSEVNMELVNQIKKDTTYYDTLQKVSIKKDRDKILKDGAAELRKRAELREKKVSSLTIWNK